MPLLMIEPDLTLPAETDVVVPPGEARVVPVARGQLLSVEAPEGGQVAALFGWVKADGAEWLSPHHTRVFGGTFVLRMGSRMVTNRRRPMFVVGRDSLRRHDLLLPASTGAVETVERALADAGLVVPRIPDPVHLFLDARIRDDGSLEVRTSPARPGERLTVRVLIDGTVVLAACPTAIAEASAVPPRPLRMTVRNRLEDLPPDLPVYGSS
jgi:uncharacterized protein YcgI (DUF1989 family)